MSTSTIEFAVKMTLNVERDGTVAGRSDITASETMKVYGGATVIVPVSMPYPVTGSASGVAFSAGVAASVESLMGPSGYPANVNRMTSFAGALRDGVVWGTLTYMGEFESVPEAFMYAGSWSSAIETSLR